ncbi:hypothetical protein J5N97_022638 [Dioscorea zingiberensis]|uniref:Uncharacterized protein n=1 Tax=Dioscorea zingiberensis TaxID=325984 RepID=A0A9D5CAY5_9LILI|nr:hypothetical protein J5N97_022638 [Dioscorea zingiberensis]
MIIVRSSRDASVRVPAPAALAGGGATPLPVPRGPVHRSSRPAPRRGEAGRRSSARRAPGGGRGGPSSASARGRCRRGATRSRDAQAGVPSAGRPRAQLAFKDSMVHGILQFTPSIAFRYVLHRCESRDIRCRESFFYALSLFRAAARGPGGPPGAAAAPFSVGTSLARAAPGGSAPAARAPGRGVRGGLSWRRGPGFARSRALPAGAAAPRRRTGSRVFPGLSGLDNDPSAGSPTETLLRLLLPLNDKVQWTSRDVAGGETAPVAAIRTLHRTIQSVGATGGVYKGQGRSQRELMTRAY